MNLNPAVGHKYFSAFTAIVDFYISPYGKLIISNEELK